MLKEHEKADSLFNIYIEKYKKIAPEEALKQKELFKINYLLKEGKYDLVIKKSDSLLLPTNRHVLNTRNIALLYKLIGTALYKSNRSDRLSDQTELYLKNSFNIGKKLEIYSETIEVGGILSDFYKEKKQYQKAYELVKTLEIFKQEYQDKRNLLKVLVLTREYEDANRKQKLKTLNAEKKALNAQINADKNQKTLVLVVVFTIFLLLLLISYGYYKVRLYAHKLRKQNENYKLLNNELKKTNIELDSFVYRTSHDLRAPLVSVLGLLNLITIETKQEDVKNYAKLSKMTLKKLDYFISDVLDYARTKHKRKNKELVEINLKGSIDDILTQLNFIPGYNLVSVSMSIEPTETIKTDLLLFAQVIKNLLSNAIKYSAAFNKSPEVLIQSLDTPDGYKYIIIKDNGPGINEKYKEKIFDIFERADQKVPGSGLGLYIAREAAQSLHGQITYNLRTNPTGSVFTFMHPN